MSHVHARSTLGPALEQIAHWNETGRHDLARERARASLQEHPESADLMVALGGALEGLGRAREAGDAARAALGIESDHVGALLLLGRLAQKAGRNREAEEHFLAALRSDPEDPGLLLAYAQLLYAVERFDKAEALARAALTRDPEYAAAHSLLSLILTAREKAPSHARLHGAQGVGLSPESDLSHTALGIQYYRSGRPFAAKRHLREALRLDPEDHDAETMFHEVDLATRWIYVPFYYWSLALDRLPGRQFAVWGVAMIVILLARQFGLEEKLLPVILAYVAWIAYTWLATPLVKLWVRLRPPR
jgi:tetratricopeptide (TPR) repeat protein